ncbi:MAG: aminotransferase class I/II-fold pyridoxal phosphate-dependent enzyme, partial [Clostridia bacterium]|nr:aminotransferase class I/II-fold pyridoxal phosphate-dependent enzyme [Clostridia bacterium]
DGLVIYCGSFSKVLSAGMRVGFVIAPKPVISKLVVAKQVSDVHTNLFFQMLTHRFITQCDLDAHIERIRAIYRHKSSLMLDSMDACLKDGSVFTRPEGGLFIWCTLPAKIDMLAFCKKAAAAGVAVVPGVAFSAAESDACNSYRLNFSTPSDAQIEKGIAVLGGIRL